jgi:hypothetical protein
MARLTTKSASVIANLFSYKSGNQYAVRSDGHVLYKNPLTSGWKIRGIIAEGTPAEYVERLQAKGLVTYRRGMQPSYESLRAMVSEGVCSATDGCDSVEPDSRCEHDFPAWPLALGML